MSLLDCRDPGSDFVPASVIEPPHLLSLRLRLRTQRPALHQRLSRQYLRYASGGSLFLPAFYSPDPSRPRSEALNSPISISQTVHHKHAKSCTTLRSFDHKCTQNGEAHDETHMECPRGGKRVREAEFV
ncbi:hypothetical protein D9611_008362 [Ephemerocybe angulata]|uniref:Uncharacterized protein n=1 Tax=Ephemerocybe angulata TaxID=980116 RepID=A0A8H5BIT7_9AGAR|nr:hypothetical protein D9611_008362 [Tulosesus angulatus]